MRLYPNVTLIFAIWLISILFVAYTGFLTLPNSQKFSNDFLKSFSNWDGGHFLTIAQYGYRENFQYAFFPFYPLVIKAFYQITQNYLGAAILISVASAFLGMQLLYRLIVLDFDKKMAEKVTFSLLIFPTSFYFITAYSEGLFFLLVVSSFYFLRSKRILLAGITAALASATRVVGIALIAALIIDIWTREGINKKNWYILLSLLGISLYCWYLFNQTSDPFYFISAQTHWQRTLTSPAVSFWETIRSLATPGFITENFNAFLDLLFAIFGLGMVLRSFRFLPVAFGIFAVVSVLLPLFTPSLSSVPRFLLPIFPMFILIAGIKNKYIAYGYQLISIMLLAVFTVLFFSGYWVA